MLNDIEGANFGRQKILEKKLQVFFAKELLKEITKYYWDAFEALNLISDEELNSIVCSIDTQDFWNECLKLMVDKGYVEIDNLLHLKADLSSLINLYRLHAVHYVTN